MLLLTRSDVIPGDAKDCRKHALRCAELAVAARTPQLKATFRELSKNWERLAILLDDVLAKLSESEDIEWRVQASLKEAGWFSNLAVREK